MAGAPEAAAPARRAVTPQRALDGELARCAAFLGLDEGAFRRR
jgi:hypothetical protein